MTPAITPELRERAGKAARIEDTTSPPVVGQRYLVPTVFYPWHGIRKAWPVMGPRHEDGEHLGFYDEHYHVDIRFVSPSDLARLTKWMDAGEVAARFPLFSQNEAPHPSRVWRSRICHRASNDYPLHNRRINQGLERLRSAYAGRRCGKNAEGLLVCPHKGFVLNSLARDERGRVVCPLHGLVIDMAAEVVTPLDAPPATPLATGEAA